MVSPPLNQTPVWTFVLTSASMTFTVNDNIKILALNCISGTINITGSQEVQNNPSAAIQLSTSNPNMTIGGEEYPIASLIVDATGGSVQLIAYF